MPIHLPFLTKPLYGQRCNGCGLCCAATLCELGIGLFHPGKRLDAVVPGPCPALEYDTERTWCGLARNPLKYVVTNPGVTEEMARENILKCLPLGQGCGMEDLPVIDL